jgi:2-polyprenyl-6-methoxyphenol hydroxylase-like FAD-dependent oxidoreductase
MVTTLPQRQTEVLIVGAGPTGLMAAVVLARAGIDAVLIDPKSGPTRESRALGVQARSMELYDQLGLVDRVLAGSTTAEALELGWADRPGHRLELTFVQEQLSRYPGLHVFEQSRNEQLLVEALDAVGRTVSWGERLVDLTTGPDGVVALTDTSSGDEPADWELSRISARWCIGADGAGSAVRRLLDVSFDGVTDPGRFWVADVQGVHGLPEGVINLRPSREDLLLTFPLGADGHVRLLGIVGDDQPTAESVIPRAAATYGFDYGPVEWFAHYRVHHRVASAFRRGPVFLAGDAAHVHSPVGGQGMNTGLQDAHNLALAIADVASGRTDGSDGAERRLDRYQAERMPVARHLVELTDRAFGVMSGRTRGRSLVRRLVATNLAPVALAVVPRLPARKRFGGYLGQTRIRYPMPAGDDPVVGRRLPPAGDNHDLLRDFGWQLHRYGGTVATADGETLGEPEEIAGATDDEVAADVAASRLPEWIGGPFALPADREGTLRPDRLYLIRPDGFVAASAPAGDPTPLLSALAAHGLGPS